jgi:hypothetical protein
VEWHWILERTTNSILRVTVMKVIGPIFLVIVDEWRKVITLRYDAVQTYRRNHSNQEEEST